MQAVLALVDVPQRVVLGRHANDRDDRPERFLPAQAHVIRDVVHQRRPHQVLVPPPFRSHRRALRDGILHQALDEVRGLGGHHRRDLCVVLGRAHRQSPHFLLNLRDQVICDFIESDDDLHGGASLSAVAEPPFDDGGRRQVEVRVREDDARVLAPEFHLHRDHARLT